MALIRANNKKIVYFFASHLKLLKIYADWYGEFVYHDSNIIYKRFESTRTKADHESSWNVLFVLIYLCA